MFSPRTIANRRVLVAALQKSAIRLDAGIRLDDDTCVDAGRIAKDERIIILLCDDHAFDLNLLSRSDGPELSITGIVARAVLSIKAQARENYDRKIIEIRLIIDASWMMLIVKLLLFDRRPDDRVCCREKRKWLSSGPIYYKTARGGLNSTA